MSRIKLHLGKGGVILAPILATAPAITSEQPGIYQVGVLLTVSDGTYTNASVITARQWKRDGVNISGATGVTYRPVTADANTTITAAVTVTNSSGSLTTTATGVGPVVTPATAAPDGVLAQAWGQGVWDLRLETNTGPTSQPAKDASISSLWLAISGVSAGSNGQITLKGTGGTFDGFFFGAGQWIKVLSPGWTISNCQFKSGAGSAADLFITASNTTVHHCDFDGDYGRPTSAPGTAIKTTGALSNLLIYRNRIHGYKSDPIKQIQTNSDPTTRPQYYENYFQACGWHPYKAALSVQASVTSNQITVNRTAPTAWVGQDLRFLNPSTGAQYEKIAVSSVSGSVAYLAANPASNYAVGTDLSLVLPHADTFSIQAGGALIEHNFLDMTQYKDPNDITEVTGYPPIPVNAAPGDAPAYYASQSTDMGSRLDVTLAGAFLGNVTYNENIVRGGKRGTFQMFQISPDAHAGGSGTYGTFTYTNNVIEPGIEGLVWTGVQEPAGYIVWTGNTRLADGVAFLDGTKEIGVNIAAGGLTGQTAAVPTAPVISTFDSILSTSARIIFDQADDARSGHQYSYSTTGPSSGFNTPVTMVGGTHVISGLAPSTQHWFKLRGVNPIGNGPYSNVVTVTTTA